ncbi:alpha/beta hydrolase [Tamlana sp. I1]|uniref:alpha/beta hydrolase n=1 Tax=Tamlana sp. I1 TaxID=2762061 RepID=UPI00188F22ED|nr:alpha/beta hydrolase [Tamlana sp. I1]
MKNVVTSSLKYKIWIMILLFGSSTKTFSQNEEIPLWDEVPNSIKSDHYQEEFRLNDEGEATGIRKVTNPRLKVFLADNNKTNNTAVVICPGGGYAVLSHDKEGDKIAKWLNTLGISAFVLKYRLPSDEIMKDKSIGPLQDAQEALRTVRRHAKDWHINPNKIGIIGFSAGGHLASTLSTHYADKVYKHDKTSAQPDFSILIYPVISMKDGITHQGSKKNLLGESPSEELVEKYSNENHVNANTAPTFLIHASNDGAVPVENSINYYLALKENNVPAELHIYEDGGHGFGLGTKGTHTNWPKACENWLLANNYIMP